MNRIAIALTASLLAAGLAGCGGDEKPAATEPTAAATKAATPDAPESEAPKTESLAGDESAVLKVADTQAEASASKDHAGAWDLLTAEAQALITREDYVTLGETCDRGGMPMDVEFVRFDDPENAVVRLGVGEMKQVYNLRLEDRGWRWESTPAAMKAYSGGLDSAIAAMGC